MLSGIRHRKLLAIALSAAVLLAGAAWVALTKLGGGGSAEGARPAQAEPLPELLARQETSKNGAAQAAKYAELQRRAAAAASHLGPNGMPPASAGTNGSFKPPPPAERRRIAARTHPAAGPYSAARTAVLLGGTALAPPGAPDLIQGVISAANLLVGQPYKWGGGHSSWRSAGYDCSGAVSFALAGGGLLQAPMASGQFMSWGAPGPGQWLTIYANPGHVYGVVAGLRWDTVGDAKGSGPRWHPFDAYPSGFTARHLPGY